MGLFRRDKEKDAAAQVEVERLLALPLPDLAAEVMRAFGPDGLQTRSGHRQGPVEVGSWLIASYSSSVRFRQPLLGPTIEALEALNQAGLLQRRSFGGSNSNASTYHLTRAGEEALAAGDVRDRLPGPGAAS
jgi:hypothetical protein